MTELPGKIYGNSLKVEMAELRKMLELLMDEKSPEHLVSSREISTFPFSAMLQMLSRNDNMV